VYDLLKGEGTMKRNPTIGKMAAASRTALSRRDVLRTFGGLALTTPLPSMLDSFLASLVAREAEASKKQVENLAMRFAKYYKPIRVTTTPQIPSYKLPLDLNKIANFEDVSAKLRLTADEPSLKANGFAVLPGKGTEDIVEPYKDLKQREIPIFITADTLLHLYHVQFDETLKEIEEREFYKDLVALTETLVKELEGAESAVDSDDFRAAHQKALTYFAIGLKALKSEAAIPRGVQASAVNLVLEKMQKHEGFWPDPRTAHTEWPLFRYAEDFSQYVPRGHYTRSEVLMKYFVGMMWFGRMAFLLKGDPSYGPDDQPALVSVPESHQQTLAAALITKSLEQAELPDKRKARDVWERIYTVTSFYVGLADDLGWPEYRAALSKVCGAALNLAVLADSKNLLAFKVELARLSPPAIYSGTGGQGTYGAGPDILLKALQKTMGFRFMGQRFIPDSYMMGQLVFPTVGKPTRKGMFTYVMAQGGPIRGFPRGLDVMAVLGSQRARELLQELGDDAYQRSGRALSYDEAVANLKNEYGKVTEADWNRNLYWSWLHALKPLLAEYGKGYQAFMNTQAYRTKSLNTALASWAQLRHDTILYAKQSYTMLKRVDSLIQLPEQPPKPVQGYVEPVPEFYARLVALARMTNQGLAEMNVLDAAAKKRLTALEKLLERLLGIAEKELANKELRNEDYEFIRNFGENLESLIVLPKPGDWGSPAVKTTLIADVHTDQNTESVLEEGTGYVDLGVFVYQQPDGRLVLGVGPVLSYYEFKQPMRDRLTDEKWRQMLASKDAPERLPWTSAYLSSRSRYHCMTRD
jgi:hypothetical protein